MDCANGNGLDCGACGRGAGATSPRQAAALVLAALLAVAIAVGIGRRAPGVSETVSYTRMAMDTPVTITVPAGEAARGQIDRAFARIAGLERLLSETIEGSDIARLNAAGGEWTDVSDETLDLFAAVTTANETTEGAFSVGVGPLLSLWGHAATIGRMPSPGEIAAARDLCAATIEIDRDRRRIRLSREGASVTIGGIAKGFIVDRAGEALADAGALSFIVDGGGDLLVRGGHPAGGPWRVAIRDPFGGAALSGAVIELRDGAVATSGNYERFFEIDGQRFSKIISPVTGRPVAHVASVTVIARDTTTADALATGLMAAGPEEGIRLAEAIDGVEALFITGEETAPIFRATQGFPADLDRGDRLDWRGRGRLG